ncbi:nucleotidyltransferase family protein [Cognaticolwellia beringensis]|nr:nucleotidyltransferase family protein [Cognaticolwellia beringensis]
MTSHLNNNVAIIVLAAGQSSRLGQMKQLINIKDKSLVEWQLEEALKVSSKVYCVLGFKANEVKARIDHLPINTIINHKFSDGMASSIAAGVAALAPDIKAVMIVLVDQWQLTSADLIRHQIFWQESPHAIVVSQDINLAGSSGKEKVGPPVIFSQNYFTELKQLTGKQGAKPLLEKHQDNVLKVPLAHAFFDIDTPEQLNNMYKNSVLKHNVTSMKKG